MLPSKHFLFGVIFAGILYLIFPEIGFAGFFIVAVSSFLIDVDHYLYYVFSKKNLSLRQAYNWSMKRRKEFFALPWKERNNFQSIPCILHGIEILLILFLLGIFLHKYFLFAFVGFAFHLLLDAIHQTTEWERVCKISLVRDFLTSRKFL